MSATAKCTMTVWWWRGGRHVGQWNEAHPESGTAVELARNVRRMGYVAHVTNERPYGRPTEQQFREVGV